MSSAQHFTVFLQRLSRASTSNTIFEGPGCPKSPLAEGVGLREEGEDDGMG